jgi:thioredoxin reductase (NADPH)
MLDILIIGSGPAGLSAAVYGKRADLSVLVAEKEYMGTGQIADSNQVDNYLGIPQISGYDLGEQFRSHAESLGVEFYEGEAVALRRTSASDIATQEKMIAESSGQSDACWQVEFEDGSKVEAKTVIYAAGCRHRNLEIPGEAEFLGKGISFCAVCDGAFYKGKEVAVIGGGNTALDDALYLSAICSKVYLIHRRNEFRGAASTVEKLRRQDNVEIVTPAKVEAISEQSVLAKEDTAAEKKKTSQKVLSLDNGRELSVDGIFVAVGMIPQTKILEGLVELDGNGYVQADEEGVTSQAGLFVAGDVRAKSLRQVITAASDGANAAMAAARYLLS